MEIHWILMISNASGATVRAYAPSRTLQPIQCRDFQQFWCRPPPVPPDQSLWHGFEICAKRANSLPLINRAWPRSTRTATQNIIRLGISETGGGWSLAFLAQSQSHAVEKRRTERLSNGTGRVRRRDVLSPSFEKESPFVPAMIICQVPPPTD